jgi:hypothetical protein
MPRYKTAAEDDAFAEGLAMAAKYVSDHASSEEDPVCQQMCFDLAGEIVALEPISKADIS